MTCVSLGALIFSLYCPSMPISKAISQIFSSDLPLNSIDCIKIRNFYKYYAILI
jgi:hypothetical protein